MVDFLIVGAQKCGTSSLAKALEYHPEICFSKEKEPYFFNKSDLSSSEIKTYHRLFDHKKEGQLCGEGSTHYTFFPIHFGVPEKIHKYNPDMKIIYMVRNPVERLISLYNFMQYRGEISESFHEAVLRNPQFINVGRYYMQIKPYLDLFGRGQVKIVVFEEFVMNQKDSLKEMASFLEIDSDWDHVKDVHTNSSSNVTYPKSGVINKIRSNKLIRNAFNLFPSSVKSSVKGNLYTKTEKIELTDKEYQKIYGLFELDVLEVEKLIGRKLNYSKNEFR